MTFYNTGIFRIKRNGSELMTYTVKPSAYLILNGNDLFFQKYDTGSGLSLYRNQIDGKQERLLINDAVVPVMASADKLYYAGTAKHFGISSFNLKSYTKKLVYDGSYLFPIFKNDYIYYLDSSDDNKLYRMLSDGSEPELLAAYHCSTYNITNSGKYLYFQIDDGINNGIYRIKTDTLATELLLPGDYKQIHVTSSYVFFKDYDNSNTYVIAADGINDVNLFDPEAAVSKKK